MTRDDVLQSVQKNVALIGEVDHSRLVSDIMAAVDAYVLTQRAITRFRDTSPEDEECWDGDEL
ncbi:hypothetical protein ACFQ69_36420 [Streptomyces sp. NPDC056470]|uniref:hypothetical protein n=1 Tax=Streptomyces sp. NPDC056470 TaxID=3345831 RepID=UPI0036AC8B71